jgi:DNA-binding GntR family transcriptional regulator
VARAQTVVAVVGVPQAVVIEVRERIAGGRLRAGEKLRQEVLARELGVSVPPVREALQTLEAEGQVVHLPRRGYFVASMSYSELAELYRIRELLETEAVLRGVPLLDTDQLRQLRLAARDVEKADQAIDLAGLTTANRRFHFTVFDAAGMPRLTELIRVLWDSSDQYRALYFTTPQHRHAVNAEHRAILAALLDRDADLAAQLLREHREHALAALKTTLAADAEQEPLR